MHIMPPIQPRVNRGCDRSTSVPRPQPIDPERLEGRQRRAWEDGIFLTPGLKGSRMHLVRVLLDEFCWGKCWCYPGDELLALKCGLGTATINRSLRDLVKLAVIRIVTVRGRRRIVFPSHPHARAYLAEIGVPTDPESIQTPAPAVAESARTPAPEPADHPVGPADQSDATANQNDCRIVPVKLREESRNVTTRGPEPGPTATEISLSGSNESTRTEPSPVPTPKPTFTVRRPIRGAVDLSAAPMDDPIIARYLAGRNRKPEAVPSAPSRDEIIASALGGQEPGQDRPGRADGVRVDSSPLPASDEPKGDSGGVSVDVEAETIRVISKLRPSSSKAEVQIATARLANLFGDRKSAAFYRSVVNEVVRGQLPADTVAGCVRSARGKDVRNQGAAFTAKIKRCKAVAFERARSARPILTTH